MKQYIYIGGIFIKLFLKQFSIRNFKGIKSFDLSPGEHNYISGRNATGKTCVFDAYCFLLFGRNSSDRPDFKAYPADDSGDPYVEGVFDIDGCELRLCVKMSKRWDHSERIPKFKGFEIKRWVNDRAVNKEEYAEVIEDICETDIFKILTNPCAMEFIPWGRLRQILNRLSPAAPYRAVAEESERLKELVGLLDEAAPEELKPRLAMEIGEIKSAIEEIPVKRGEVLLNIGEEGDIEEIDIKIKGIKEEIKEAQNLIAVKKKPNADIRELSRLEGIRQKTLLRLKEKELETKNKLCELERQLRDKNSEIKHLSDEAKKLENTLTRANRRAEELDVKIAERENAEIKVSEYCSLCGNKLKKGQINAMVEKMAEEKKAELEAMYGKYELILFEISSLKDELEKNSHHINKLKDEASHISGALAKVQPVRYEKGEVDKSIDQLKLRIAPLTDEVGRLEDYISNLNERLETLYEAKNKVIANINAKKRLSELDGEEKGLKNKLKELKYRDSLLDELIKRTMEYSSLKINSHFERVYFKMYRDFIKGGSENCCIAEIDGVGYADLNRGGKTEAGLELIKGLSDYFGIYVPVFIDNRESLTSLSLPKSQIFELKVTDERELRCWYE